MNFQDALRSLVVCDHDDIRFLADSDLVSDRVDAFVLLVGVEREVIKSAVGESVAII